MVKNRNCLIPKHKFHQVENYAAGAMLSTEKGLKSYGRGRLPVTLSIAGICPQILWVTLWITMLLATQVLDLAGE